MPAEIFKRPQALRDIEECFVYIAENNVDIGIRFLIAVENSMQQIAEFPFIGKERRFANKQFQSIRMWHVRGFENHLIFYLTIEATVEVIRVLYGSRNIEELFN